MEFNEIAQKRYQTDFIALAKDRDRKEAVIRMRYLLGVAIKKQFSDERRITDSKGNIVDVKWRINPSKLAAMPNDSWQIQLLKLAPDRRPRESGKQVAKRLKREVVIANAYAAILHPLLCQSPEYRRAIRAVLQDLHFGKLAPLTRPEALILGAAGKLFVLLGGASASAAVATGASATTVALLAAAALPPAALAMAAFALCVNGLNYFCKRPRPRTSGKAH
jgi:hypothetical protein